MTVCMGFLISAVREERLSRPGCVGDVELAGEICEARVGCPQFCARDERRSEEMDVDPADTSAVELAPAHELDDFAMGDRGRMRQLQVAREHGGPAAPITNQKLTEHEIVSQDLASIQQ